MFLSFIIYKYLLYSTEIPAALIIELKLDVFKILVGIS